MNYMYNDPDEQSWYLDASNIVEQSGEGWKRYMKEKGYNVP